MLNLLIFFKKSASYAGAFLISVRKDNRDLGLITLIVLITSALYAGFFASPPFFDDINFYRHPGNTLLLSFQATPRWLPYWSMDMTWHYFGLDPTPYRITNLAIHMATVIVLYILLRQLLGLANRGHGITFSAFAGSLLFSVHPVAVFACGYMIQRTVLMATLFSLLMFWAFLRGSLLQRPKWLYMSACFFVVAVYSKEHAVTAASVCLVFVVWLWRSRIIILAPTFWITRHYIAVFCIYGCIMICVIASKFGLLATPYEPSISYLLVDLPFDPRYAYPMSVFSQTGLFFKFLFLWAVPNTAWMSIDMREPIAAPTAVWPYILTLLAFTVYSIQGARLLWRGGRVGLWGIAILTPVLMFFTELSTVRIQEPFVLYRSYLWLPVTYGLAISGIFTLLSARVAWVILLIMTSSLAIISANQLHTFTQAQFIWDQAAQLTIGRKNILGSDRIFHNRGQAYHDLGFSSNALQDYNTSIALAPNLPYSYNNRGALLLDLGKPREALADFNRSLSIKPSPNSLLGRGLAYTAIGNITSAHQDFFNACTQGVSRACKILEQLSDRRAKTQTEFRQTY